MMPRRLENWLINAVLYGSMVGILIVFFLPIFTLIAFSFNTGAYLIFPFEGFGFQWYKELFAHLDTVDAFVNSLIVAVVVTLIGTTLGTAAALAWVRYKFRLKRAYQALNILPLIFPQFLLGVIMLLWFSVLGNWFDFSPSLVTVVVGHVVYITPFAMIVVAVQIHAFDDTLEDAARDLGAKGWTVFKEITLPLLWPGIFSAAIFVFLLSWGNFYITYNLNGGYRTVPTFVFAGLAMGGLPIYPTVATLVFIPGLILVAVAEHFRRRAMAR